MYFIIGFEGKSYEKYEKKAFFYVGTLGTYLFTFDRTVTVLNL